MITECTERSGSLEPMAYSVTSAINKDTTPEEFDRILDEHKDYKFKYGGRCGWNALGAAAYEGNLDLISHIVDLGGKKLLNLGNEFGWTPIYCAANCENNEDGFNVAKKLLELDADPNIATYYACGDSSKGPTPEGVTPLWAAAEKTKNLELIQLLLLNGAVEPPKLSKEGKELISSVQEKMKV